MRDQPMKRCAIYTRKSTEEGLDQAFNSLDAQYEACAAYVLSQQHEGWMLASGRYDDGGFSGGNLLRPGLVQLLADVKAGLVDVIIIYKIDRLTRCLTDFAKIVDVLDGAGASFVSITQSFNTTTSMGRLTLNVLLSFAQFEREVISERVRDKVAASKARGMWMGGGLPLGYDVKSRELIINAAEAEHVRYIFRRYLELGTVAALRVDLQNQGITTKQHTRPDGTTRGGNKWWPGPLYAILKNRIYIGKIVHKDKCYEGMHERIVDDALFEAVQTQLADNRVKHSRREYAKHGSLLTGMISDGLDRPLTPRQANKGSKRYRYYVSNGIPREDGSQTSPIWRIPAVQIEKAVLRQVADLIEHTDRWFDHDTLSANQSRDVRRAAHLHATALRDGKTYIQRDMLKELGLSIRVFEDRIDASISGAAAAQIFALSNSLVGDRIAIDLAPTIKNVGQELRMVFAPQNLGWAVVDEKLVELIVDAHRARDALAVGTDQQDIRKLRRQARFAWLAPDVIVAITEGRHPIDLTARNLLRSSTLPLSWQAQRAALGFGH